MEERQTKNLSVDLARTDRVKGSEDGKGIRRGKVVEKVKLT